MSYWLTRVCHSTVLILSSHVAQCLPTLPFQVLQVLFQSTPPDSAVSAVLREDALQIGAVQLVMACLAVLSHHEPRVTCEVDRIALQAMATLTGRYRKIRACWAIASCA